MTIGFPTYRGVLPVILPDSASHLYALGQFVVEAESCVFTRLPLTCPLCCAASLWGLEYDRVEWLAGRIVAILEGEGTIRVDPLPEGVQAMCCRECKVYYYVPEGGGDPMASPE